MTPFFRHYVRFVVLCFALGFILAFGCPAVVFAYELVAEFARGNPWGFGLCLGFLGFFLLSFWLDGSSTRPDA